MIDKLKVSLERCANRAEADPREYWEAWEMNMGREMYNRWVVCYEFLEGELGIESIRMKPANREICAHYAGMGAELPWLRLVTAPAHRYTVGGMESAESEIRPVYCRFEGRYKWTWTIATVHNPLMFFYGTIRGEASMYYTLAEWMEPELEDRTTIEKCGGVIGEDYSLVLGSDNSGWINIISKIIDIESKEI